MQRNEYKLKPIRVLVISHACVQRSWRKKFAEMGRQKDVEIVLLLPEYWVENYRVVRLESREDMNCSIVVGKAIWTGYGNRYFFVSAFVNILQTFKPDIIHLEQEPGGLIALQTVVYRKLFAPRAKLIFRTSRSRKGSFDFVLRFKRGVFLRTIERLTYKSADFAFPLSQRGLDLLRRKGYKKGAKVLPNGVDLDMFKEMEVSALKKDMGLAGFFLLGYVGRLGKEKGLSTLLEAVAGMEQDVKLLFVGSGPWKSSLVELTERLNLSAKLTLMDTVPQERVPTYMNCMDVLVLPSVTTSQGEEFFGRVLIEAMACGVPVVGSDCGEIPNVIGDAGLIFEENNAEDLRRKLLQVIDDDQLRNDLVRRGKRQVSNYFAWEKIAEETLRTYRQLCQR